MSLPQPFFASFCFESPDLKGFPGPLARAGAGKQGRAENPWGLVLKP